MNEHDQSRLAGILASDICRRDVEERSSEFRTDRVHQQLFAATVRTGYQNRSYEWCKFSQNLIAHWKYAVFGNQLPYVT